MGPFEIIVAVALVGFLLLAAEMFVPGLVLGVLGGLCLVAAVILAYFHYGALAGSLVLASVCVLALGGIFGSMAVFPHTPIGRRITLAQRLVIGDSERSTSPGLLGQQGRALTPLRPAGAALLGGRKVDVVAESDFISPEEPVVVIREEGLRVVVRKIALAG